MSSSPPPSRPSVKAFATGKHSPTPFPPHVRPVPSTLEDVIREQTQTRRLLEEHIKHSIEERKAAKLRDDAIMSMLKDLITRVP